MATYAEYSQQAMAQNDHPDFTLYPFDEVLYNNQAYLPPSTTYADQSYIQPISYDSYANQTAFAPSLQDHQYAFAPANHLAATKAGLQAPSPNHSPAHSASHSFDLAGLPAHLSSTSDSGASVQSTLSSAMGSPSVHPQSNNDWAHQMVPGIVQHDGLVHDMLTTSSFDFDTIPATTEKGCVDPSLIQPTFSPTQYTGAQFPDIHAVQSPQNVRYPQAPSPVPSKHSVQSPRNSSGKAASPYTSAQVPWAPYPNFNGSRRHSNASAHSRQSHGSISSSDDSNKGLCPIATCGRHVKDLKAHMLTHQNERPEKCPIPTCEYHTKGFARKYDKNRHTLTHYKGTMVCGFCPGSGSSAEKSFNRADVFKRHLTSVHGVEQTPPNARRRSPTGTGKRVLGQREASGTCSTCGGTFLSPQDFYEHLDDCVLRVVQQADPSEAINQALLSSVADDQQVQETMERHALPTAVDLSAPTSFDQDEEADEDDEDGDDDEATDGTYGNRSGRSGKGGIKSRKAAGVNVAGSSS